MCRLLLVVGLLMALIVPFAETAKAAGEEGRAAAVRYTIRTSNGSVSRIGAFRIRRDATIRAAARIFGRPSTRKLRGDNECQVDWRRLRLRIYFANFGGHGPGETTCSSRVGLAQSFTARGRRFRTWGGLRVGDRSEMILDRHENAEFRRGTWWLRTAVSPFGDESEYAVVEALVGGGRVRVLRGWIGAAGE
jgi:hypothetical protein